jgi:hypothetical protein
MYSQYKSVSLQDDMEDKVRFQLESSDRLQGFQLLCDTNAGYGGLA